MLLWGMFALSEAIDNILNCLLNLIFGRYITTNCACTFFSNLFKQLKTAAQRRAVSAEYGCEYFQDELFE